MPDKSGKPWIAWANTHATNSKQIADLDPIFKPKVVAFIAALEAAGAKVEVRSTKRSAKRAYLFHWSWRIGLGKVEAKSAGKMAGVDIEWDHGDKAKSEKAAMEMVDGFGLAVPPSSTNPPSLTSNHISGKAIDMDITWTSKIKVKKKDGKEVEITFMANPNLNAALHQVGESYGVKKLKTDKPHWSHDGH